MRRPKLSRLATEIGTALYVMSRTPAPTVAGTGDYSREDLAKKVTESLELRVIAHGIASGAGPGQSNPPRHAFPKAEGFDPNAAPMSGEAAVRYAPPARTCPDCHHVFPRAERQCPECGKQLPRLRDRVRSPKLYACDIETGGEYVPKRGNDKTPNYIVVMVTNCENSGVAERVWWRRTNEQDRDAVHPTGYPVDEFLALVSRRVDA